MKIIKTKAIVLKERILLKNDAIITLFTQKMGKIKAVAKGIKKITSRRLSHTDSGNLLEVLLVEKKDSFYLQQTTLISSFSSIKSNRNKINFLIFVLFLLDRLLPENQEEKKIFFQTLTFFSHLAKIKINIIDLFKFCQQLLIDLGYGKKFTDMPSLLNFIKEIINENLPVIDYN